jgi:hypothetical protein
MRIVGSENEKQIMESGLMDEKQFLKRIGRCRASLHQMKRNGLISFLKSGRRTLYDEQSYQDFLSNCTKRIPSIDITRIKATTRSLRRPLGRRGRRRNK